MLINVESRPFHEECKTKLITCKQQTTQKNKKHRQKDRNALKASW